MGDTIFYGDGRPVFAKEPIELTLENGTLTLGKEKLRYVEEHKIEISSALPKGKAELTLKMLVNFSDNRQEHNP